MNLFSSLLSMVLAGVLAMISNFDMRASGLLPLTERRYMDVPLVVTDSVHRIDLSSRSGLESYMLEVRGAMAGIEERAGLARHYWGADIISGRDTIRVTLRHGNSSFGDIFDRRENHLSVVTGENVLFNKDISNFESSSGVYNTLRLEIDLCGGNLNLSGGGRKVEDICSLPLPNMADGVPAVELWSRGELSLSTLFSEASFSPECVFATRWSNEPQLSEYLMTSTDPLEGYWQYLDRENDPQYARLGGRYMLALVKSDESAGDYDIVYIGGAETMRDRWKPYMLKGRLKQTVFLNHYDLMWIDSTFEPITQDIHASVTDGAILTLSFPLLKTTLRFSRMMPK
ncbi:MAG: hypothetical protein NC212_00505 [Staphylococcus sp.]|nr:hypothetical protein [Staphylococcus sp.]